MSPRSARPRRRARVAATKPARFDHLSTRALWAAVSVVAFGLLLTVDDRYAGAIPDGRQMTWTAVALAETGELGQARGRDFTWPRPAGDAVSRYGMGMSLAQFPAAWLAPRIEERFGPGSSQPLFLIVPIVCVCAAAAAAGWIALALGLGPLTIACAVLLAGVGSPLGAYAALDLSEPLQAAALVLALACAAASGHSEPDERRAIPLAAAAGFAAGVAVLTKASLWLTVPCVLLPLWINGGQRAAMRRLVAAAAGLAVPAGLWAWFEVARFGRLFAGYGGEGFTHAFLDGVWRLLVGPNRGFVWFFPAVVPAVASLILVRRGTAKPRSVAVGGVSAFVVLLMMSATWWAWHGLWGWGPRLVVPAVPLLAVAAAIVVDRWPPPAVIALTTVSIVVNLPGLIQNAAPVTVFTATCEWPEADPAFARSLAAYARREGPGGAHRVAPDQVLETVPSASPFVVFPWFAAATWTRDPASAAQRLHSPPWRESRPDVRCTELPLSFVMRVLKRSGWPVWGRGFWPDPEAPAVPGVYNEGLLDQVIRAQQLGRPEQALGLSRRLVSLARTGEAHALLLESLRLLGRRSEAAEYLSSLSPEERSEPRVNVVLALFERDAGNEPLARRFLESVAAAFPGAPLRSALSEPLSAWPRDLHSMTAASTDQAGQR